MFEDKNDETTPLQILFGTKTMQHRSKSRF